MTSRLCKVCKIYRPDKEVSIYKNGAGAYIPICNKCKWAIDAGCKPL